MAFDSFRDFLGQLDRAGELVRVSQPVATELEITELADREMKKPGGGRALLRVYRQGRSGAFCEDGAQRH